MVTNKNGKKYNNAFYILHFFFFLLEFIDTVPESSINLSHVMTKSPTSPFIKI